jgi:hypothetical protein
MVDFIGIGFNNHFKNQAGICRLLVKTVCIENYGKR